MSPEDRASARRQLDKRLDSLRDLDALARPPRGWVRAIREALGMTTAQLARRLGVSQPRVVVLEQAEAKGTITLESLERAAHALDCQLSYVLIPRRPLEALVEERALQLAGKRLAAASHSMALEAQSVAPEDEARQLVELARRIAARDGSKLWQDEQ